jgi:hypothetical protein
MAIPTRFNMGQVQGSGADYFLRLLQEQGGAGARPSIHNRRFAHCS